MHENLDQQPHLSDLCAINRFAYEIFAGGRQEHIYAAVNYLNTRNASFALSVKMQPGFFSRFSQRNSQIESAKRETNRDERKRKKRT